MTKFIHCYVDRKQAVKNKPGINLCYLNIGLFALTIVLGAAYLLNMSQLTVQGFTLRELKSKIASLNNEIIENEEKVSIAQSYFTVNTKTKDLRMVAIDNVEYLSAGTVAVLRK